MWSIGFVIDLTVRDPGDIGSGDFDDSAEESVVEPVYPMQSLVI